MRLKVPAVAPVLASTMCLSLSSNPVVLAQNAAMPDYVTERDGATDPHASIADVEARASDLSDDLCAKLQGLKQAGTQTQAARRSRLAAALKAVDSALDDQRAKDIAEMDNVISAVGKATLIEWTNNHMRPHLTIASGDYAKLFLTEGIDADAEIDRICGEDSGPTVIAR